jgi:hypothetical protein
MLDDLIIETKDNNLLRIIELYDDYCIAVSVINITVALSEIELAQKEAEDAAARAQEIVERAEFMGFPIVE